VLLEGDRVVRDCRQAVIEVPIPGHDDVVKPLEEVEEGELEFFTEVLRRCCVRYIATPGSLVCRLGGSSAECFTIDVADFFVPLL